MSSKRPLYDRDPTAWYEHLAEGNAKQARKRVGADVLIRDEQEQILLVNPRYKPGWDLPGGMAEANEPPHKAAERELKEELDIELSIRKLLVVDWVSPHGPWDDSLMFVFDAGRLDKQQSAELRPTDDELSSFGFYPLQEAEALLSPSTAIRLKQATLAINRPRYLFDGILLENP